MRGFIREELAQFPAGARGILPLVVVKAAMADEILRKRSERRIAGLAAIGPLFPALRLAQGGKRVL